MDCGVWYTPEFTSCYVPAYLYTRVSQKKLFFEMLTADPLNVCEIMLNIHCTKIRSFGGRLEVAHRLRTFFHALTLRGLMTSIRGSAVNISKNYFFWDTLLYTLHILFTTQIPCLTTITHHTITPAKFHNHRVLCCTVISDSLIYTLYEVSTFQFIISSDNNTDVFCINLSIHNMTVV